MTFCFCLRSPAILPIHPPDLTTCTQKCYSRSKTLFCCFFRGRLFNENVNISLEVSSLAKVCHTSHVIIMVFSFCRTSPAILTIHLPIFYETRCRRTRGSGPERFPCLGSIVWGTRLWGNLWWRHWRWSVPTYLHTYLPTYLVTCLPTYVSTYLPTYLPTYLSTYHPTHWVFQTCLSSRWDL